MQLINEILYNLPYFINIDGHFGFVGHLGFQIFLDLDRNNVSRPLNMYFPGILIIIMPFIIEILCNLPYFIEVGGHFGFVGHL